MEKYGVVICLNISGRWLIELKLWVVILYRGITYTLKKFWHFISFKYFMLFGELARILVYYKLYNLVNHDYAMITLH